MVNLGKLVGQNQRVDIGVNRYFGKIIKTETGYAFEALRGLNGSKRKVRVPIYHTGPRRAIEQDGGLEINNHMMN